MDKSPYGAAFLEKKWKACIKKIFIKMFFKGGIKIVNF